jgi:hypothetical protein
MPRDADSLAGLVARSTFVARQASLGSLPVKRASGASSPAPLSPSSPAPLSPSRAPPTPTADADVDWLDGVRRSRGLLPALPASPHGDAGASRAAVARPAESPPAAPWGFSASPLAAAVRPVVPVFFLRPALLGPGAARRAQVAPLP